MVPSIRPVILAAVLFASVPSWADQIICPKKSLSATVELFLDLPKVKCPAWALLLKAYILIPFSLALVPSVCRICSEFPTLRLDVWSPTNSFWALVSLTPWVPAVSNEMVSAEGNLIFVSVSPWWVISCPTWILPCTIIPAPYVSRCGPTPAW